MYSNIGYYDTLLQEALKANVLEDRFELLAGIADNLNKSNEVEHSALKIATNVGAHNVVGDGTDTLLEEVLRQLYVYTKENKWHRMNSVPRQDKVTLKAPSR